MEHTKGKLYVSSSTLICDEEARIVANTMQLGTVAGVTVNITEATAYAAELVRRWNAFEDGGLVDELRKACKKAECFIENGVGLGYIKMPEIETDPAHKTLPIIKAALAKS